MGAKLGRPSIDGSPRGEKRVGVRAEQKRRWDEEARHPCATVGCEKTVAYNRTRCMACRAAADRERRDERRREIQRRWQRGESLKGIARALGTSANSIQAAIYGMRRDDWDVPYRHTYPR